MNAPVQFLFDFGSPNAYLCHKVLPAIEKRNGVVVQYVPVLLGGLFKLSNNRSPVETTADIPNKRAYDTLEIKRFIARHAITQFKFNPFFPVNTLPIMRGAVAATKRPFTPSSGRPCNLAASGRAKCGCGAKTARCFLPGKP